MDLLKVASGADVKTASTKRVPSCGAQRSISTLGYAERMNQLSKCQEKARLA